VYLVGFFIGLATVFKTRRLQSAGRSRLGRGFVVHYYLHGLEFLSRVQPSEGLLESQCPFMTGCSILRPKFLMSVGMKEPNSAIPNDSRTYRTHLFRRVVNPTPSSFPLVIWLR
jgi:hypothetical protein